jgi:hypothetical protein
MRVGVKIRTSTLFFEAINLSTNYSEGSSI